MSSNLATGDHKLHFLYHLECNYRVLFQNTTYLSRKHEVHHMNHFSLISNSRCSMCGLRFATLMLLDLALPPHLEVLRENDSRRMTNLSRGTAFYRAPPRWGAVPKLWLIIGQVWDAVEMVRAGITYVGLRRGRSVSRNASAGLLVLRGAMT